MRLGAGPCRCPAMQYKALVTTAGFIPRGMMRRMSGMAASRLR